MSSPIHGPVVIQDAFSKVFSEFVASLSPKERSLYSGCPSSEDLINKISELGALNNRHAQRKSCIKAIGRLASCLNPYFQCVDVLVSSHPEYAALVWGAFRLVFQLAANFNAFFDKLIKLLEYLIDTFPQYEMVLELRGIIAESEHRDDVRLLWEEGSGIRKTIEAVYRIIFQIIHTAVRIFTKSDGGMKSRPVIVGELMWKPFDVRFGELIEQMAENRRNLFDQLLLLKSNDYFRGKVTLASMNKTISLVQEQDAAERELAGQERRLMAEERQMNAEARQGITDTLSLLRKQMEAFEADRIEKAWSNFRSWVAAPDYISPYNKALKLCQEGTSTWIFDDPLYLEWFFSDCEPPTRFQFGPRALWIYGHPGCGKTVLASSIYNHLLEQSTGFDKSDYDVYYYFFDFRSPSGVSAISAYRSLVSQVLGREDKALLNCFTFIRDIKGRRNPVSSESVLLDLLKFGLREDSLIIIDGLDESTEENAVVESLLDLSKLMPSLRFLFLSRVTVAPLNLSIRDDRRLQILKGHLSHDIHSFYCRQFEELFDRCLLPDYARSMEQNMINDLVKGADGMFLWASLMIRYLKSGPLTPHCRLEAIKPKNFPEGLEQMYKRIIGLILQSGRRSSVIASRVLTYLLHSLLPLSSRQLRQALIVDGCFPASITLDSINAFEDVVINACGGLVERYTGSDLVDSGSMISYLRLIHFSAEELLKDPFGDLRGSTSHLPLRSSRLKYTQREDYDPTYPELIYAEPGDLVLDPVNANLYIANCCLQQLLYKTPAEPLSGKFNQRLSEAQLSSNLCFTDHSAVLWIGYLHSASTMIDGGSPYKPIHCTLFSQPLTVVIEYTWAFLKAPKTLSVWLESFYTAVSHRNAIRYKHPPTNLFIVWADALDVLGGQRELSRILREFSRDVDSLIEIWGDRLENAPEIVWDEMTGFFYQGKFFFEAGSTKVSNQDPTAPKSSNLSPQPLAVMSRTADNGDIKGVLSVWIPQELRSDHLSPSIMGSTVLDDARVSSGWVAVYEIWNLQATGAGVLRMEYALDPAQVLHHAQRYLNQNHPQTIELPLSISPDARSFTALLTLFVVSFERDGTARYLSQALQVEPPRSDLNMISLRYDTYISANNHILFHNKTEVNNSTLAIFRFQAAQDRLVVEEVHRLNPGNLANISNVIFHPKLALIAFKAVVTSVDVMYKYVIAMWLFSKATRSVSAQDFTDPDKTMKLFQFSSCGKYLIYQSKSLMSSPQIIPIPTAFLDDTAALLTLNTTNSLEERNQGITNRTKASEVTDISGHADPPKTITQIWTVGSNQTLKPTTVSVDRGCIHLSTGLGPESQTAKLIALPPSYNNLDGTTPTVVLPRTIGDPLQLSTDAAVRHSYPMAERPSSTRERAPITVFSRDPRFISAPRPLQTLLQDSADRDQIEPMS